MHYRVVEKDFTHTPQWSMDPMLQSYHNTGEGERRVLPELDKGFRILSELVFTFQLGSICKQV